MPRRRGVGDNVESYCKAHAPKSLDSYSRGAMFWRKAVQQRCQGELCDAQTAELEKQRMDRLGVQVARRRWLARGRRGRATWRLSYQVAK